MPEQLPRLRDDLRISPLKEGGEECYIVEDPLRNQFFKIGLREYLLLCRLSSAASFADLVTSTDGSETDVNEDEVLSILQWLAAKQLLQNQKVETMQAIADAEEKAAQKGLLSRLNVITFRIPLFNPDPFLNRFQPLLGWLAGPWFFVLWLILGGMAIATLLVNGSLFVSESAGFFSPANALFVTTIWIILKLLHELSHALVCKRYGGGVYDFGILFILFIPLTYVNASTSWSFANRWQRLHVAVAGIYMELFVAWLAVLYWATHMGTAGGLIAHNTVLVAGVSSFLFNANPLMRFDGYFVLSDLTGIPNLYFRGLDSVHRAARKWWLGIDAGAQGGDYSLFVRMYGIGVYFWRFLVLFGLGFIASRMFSGWGLILTIIAAVGWIYHPVATFLKKIPEYKAANPSLLSHFSIRFVPVAVLCGIILFGISWQKNISVPAVVFFEEQRVVRAESSGFVKELYVSPGTLVAKGEELLLLENPELEMNRNILGIELEKIDLQKRAVHTRGRYGELQILEDREKLLRARKQNMDTDHDALRVLSPGDGVVVGRFLESRINTLVQKGEELFLVVDSENKHLVASVAQDDITVFRDLMKKDVEVDMRLAGLGTFRAQIDKIVPRASTELLHPSLAAPFGGPLDVRSGAGGRYQLFTPRFTVYIAIPKTYRHSLRDGQQATVLVQGIRRSPAAIFWKKVKTWFLKREGVDQSEI